MRPYPKINKDIKSFDREKKEHILIILNRRNLVEQINIKNSLAAINLNNVNTYFDKLVVIFTRKTETNK